VKKACIACEADAHGKSPSKTTLVLLFVLIGYDTPPARLMASLCRKHGKKLGSMLVRIGAKPVVDSPHDAPRARFH
jgi:hypothetical protein